MKKLLPLIICILCYNLAFAQNKLKDHYEQGLNYVNQQEWDKAIATFQYIIDFRPKHRLAREALTDLGSAYFYKKEFHLAKQTFKTVLKTDFGDTRRIRGAMPVNPNMINKHEAAAFLHDIYFEQKQYDSALYFLELSHQTYPFQHFCGNAFAGHDIYLALSYAKIYKQLGDTLKATQALLPWIFQDLLSSNEEVIAELEHLFSTSKNKLKLIAEFEAAISNYYHRENDYEIAQYFFIFKGVEIPLLFEFIPRTEDREERKENILEQVQYTAFYNMLQRL